MTSMAARSGTPSRSSTVAAVWRASCSRASRTSASRRSRFHSLRSIVGSIGRPVACANIQPSSSHTVPACSRPGGPRSGAPSPAPPVAHDVPAAVRLAERCARGPVHLVGVGRPRPVEDHPRVELLEVLRADLVDPMLAETEDEVLLHRRAVRAVRLVLDRRPRDVLQPMREPRLDGHARPAFRVVPASRSLSNARTAAMTSASVRACRCLRSGEPSSFTPTVTRPCHIPSPPR